jgi:hypothetical protein
MKSGVIMILIISRDPRTKTRASVSRRRRTRVIFNL